MRGPAAVAPRALVPLVRIDVQAVEGRLAYQSRLAQPLRQSAQEAQVGLDRGRCQPVLLPHLDHRTQVLLAEVAWIGHQLEAGPLVQVAEETPQELRPVVARLVRDGLLERGVLAVEELQQHVEHLAGGHLARLKTRQDLCRRLVGPVLAASGLL